MSERIHLIKSIFSDRDEAERLRYLSGDDAKTFAEVIDQASLQYLPQSIQIRCLRTLYRICGLQAILPKSLQIPPCYDPRELPCSCGGFADVWKGEHLGQVVAAKVLRIDNKVNLSRIRKVGSSALALFISELTASITELLQRDNDMEKP